MVLFGEGSRTRETIFLWSNMERAELSLSSGLRRARPGEKPGQIREEMPPSLLLAMAVK